ncbi:MAG TPA: radical SAM family heme chaperone HemW [Gemmatimonadaceae bacterium]|nr:radical SAM family heme chaperone HemW [Gemmatimonadaceae bacterium]
MPARHLYVHVPFCARRCSYCDFAIAVRRVIPVRAFIDGVRSELAIRFPRQGDWQLDTLYLGGGTPSLLGGEGVGALLDVIRRRASLADDAEVTLEANPEDITGSSVAAWRAAGVNRLSIGSQSFDPRVLAWMHRIHSAERIGEAVRAAREEGMANFSLDFIFALPEELGRRWEDDLRLALDLEPPHVSLYGLTVEAGTPLARWRDRGAVAEAPEESYEREYLLAHQMLSDAGYQHYEVSNFGRPGKRARHNSAYWRGVPYVGVGPSAHGFDGARRRWNARELTDWTDRVAAGEDPIEGDELLSGENRMVEEVYLEMRTDAGVELRGERERATVVPWIAEGWARIDADGRLRLTPAGWLRLDSLAGVLTEARSCY